MSALPILLLVACGENQGTSGNLSSGGYAPPWASHLIYRQLEVDELAEGVDTAEPLNHKLHLETTGQDPSFTLEFRDGETWAGADGLMTWTLSTDGGLSITAMDGETLDPPMLLVGTTYEPETPVSSGEWRTTPILVESLVTWYGVFEDVLEIRVDGPAIGELYLVKDVGLVQFTWDDLAADLAWYE